MRLGDHFRGRCIAAYGPAAFATSCSWGPARQAGGTPGRHCYSRTGLLRLVDVQTDDSFIFSVLPGAEAKQEVRRGTAAATPPSGTGPSQGAPTTATTRAAARVSIDNFVFDPKELVVTAGATVTWANTDNVAHTVTSNAAPPLFDSMTFHTGDKFSFEFQQPGIYDYFCKAHPCMTGKVIVK